MFPTISITRAWYSIFLCAAVALFLGMAGTPAMAGGPHDDHGGGVGGEGEGGDNGVPALLTMTGFMSTTNFPVRVTQDSGKWLYFADTSFELPGIRMAVDTNNCGVDPFFPGGVNAPEEEDLLDELSGAFIPAGYFEIKIDKKKLTAFFTIEYFITGGPLDGRIRFLFRLGRTTDVFPFPFVADNTQNETGFDFPGTDLTITSPISIWWSNLTGLNEDKIMVCDGQVVMVQLVPDPAP